MDYHERDDIVKEHLDVIMALDGGWEHMLTLLWVRDVQREMVTQRVKQGLTQTEVAGRMDVGQSTFSELETKRYPDYHLSTLRRWCLALGLHSAWMMEPAVSEAEKEESDDATP